MGVPPIMKYPASQDVKYSPHSGECDGYRSIKNPFRKIPDRVFHYWQAGE